MKPLWKLKCGMLLALCVNAAYADDSANDKIMQLQKMLEQQQVQMKAMAAELKALQQQKPAVVASQSGAPEGEQKQMQEQQWQIQAMAEELKALRPPSPAFSVTSIKCPRPVFWNRRFCPTAVTSTSGKPSLL